MRKIAVLVSAIVIVGAASVASAKVTHVKTSSAHIKASQNGAPTDAPCTSGYATHCPSGDCQCYQFIGSVNGNQAGKGTASIQLTVDNANTNRTGTPGCRPVYASASLSGKGDVSQTLGMLGALCDGKNANSSEALNGGYGIDGSGAGLEGAGTFSGSVSPGGKLQLKLSGFIEPSL